LDEFCEVAVHHRKHAIRLLNGPAHGAAVRAWDADVSTTRDGGPGLTLASGSMILATGHDVSPERSLPMPPTYRYDHMHVRSRDVKKTAEYYHRMFDARIVESIQSDGKPRTDLDLNGLTIFIAPVPAEAAVSSAPRDPYEGLDHFGLRVENMDEAVAELKRRGADFMMEPRAIRPGVRIAFVRAPDNVRIELLERT
jgi:catechol 2,3-dioxygenase-like lactoylglutathione lyase family enzyme